MAKIPAGARARYHEEMQAAKTTPDPAQRWADLVRAHIVSQPDRWLHRIRTTAPRAPCG
ncbi:MULTISPECIES: DUF3703 domain-containing protein [Nocardia]|uniref:DUF3703 domain-containing protein n=1 Tax=Nocardia puris TaxID=208602 RepID=UPI001895EA50|nr:DUF3703 domain-containing protein [Nocardia puris]MBF6215607.1 DUF3703 domain-containing protein [Nocardia puris]